MRRGPATFILALLLITTACGDAADTAASTAPPVATSAAAAGSTTEVATTAAPATTAPPLTTTTTTIAPTTTTQPPTTTTATVPPARDDVATFFAGALAVCNDYSVETNGFAPFDGSGADPTLGVTFDEEVAPGVFRIVDGEGVELLVDFTNRVVTGVDGPEGVMPRPYSFWCPPELFPGTLDEEAFDTEALLLQPTGLGIANFGDDPDTTIAAIEFYLGPPDEDSGWIGSFSTWGTCPGSQIRVVRWDDLEVLFTDAPGTSGAYPASGVPHFFNWRTPDLFAIGDTIGLSTPEGIGIGSTVAQLTAVYGADIEIFFDDVFEFWFLRIGPPGGISGSVSGDQPGDFVQFLEAGGSCGE